jgi:hypothetical protein
MGYLHFRTEGQGLVGRGKFVGVEGFAVGGLSAVKFASVPGREAFGLQGREGRRIKKKNIRGKKQACHNKRRNFSFHEKFIGTNLVLTKPGMLSIIKKNSLGGEV